MAGVSCKAGTEAIVGLSNPSYNREGFRILFPGAAASGPSPSNPAFPSPGSLWGVTFCSILTAGNRRCTQPRQVRVASVPLAAQSSITREVGGAAALAFQATTPPPTGQERKSPPLFHRKLPVAWRAPQETDSEKMAAASAEAGERGERLFQPQEGPRSQTTSSILPAVGLQESPLPAGTVRGGRSPVSISMEADEHGKWFKEPPPPSLKSS